VSASRLVQPALGFVLAPLLLGIIARTKALWAGRRGAPLLQPYHDILRLLRKGGVYSPTTTWVFRASPVATVVTGGLALALLPVGAFPALLAFDGDFVFLAALFAAGRFVTILAALDTGSSFEGMGASREATFAALVEPALFLALAVLARAGGALSLSTALPALGTDAWRAAGPALLLTGAALMGVLLAECSRIPIDDPSTHLELTMIHEVMILDHGGPDLALLLYGSALKLWILGGLLASMLVPVRSASVALDSAAFCGGMLLLAILVGTVESTMARLRLLRVPQLLIGSAAIAGLALLLVLR
jgi:formate hydrogenlyase subunit 4